MTAAEEGRGDREEPRSAGARGAARRSGHIGLVMSRPGREDHATHRPAGESAVPAREGARVLYVLIAQVGEGPGVDGN
ncbi:hypothetical protein SSTG_04714 [Streptomyces sp. e14]|nr:hypothetical protein SSTG_04714 [Streptomyces sp. e14]